VEYDSKVTILFRLNRFDETEKALVEAAAHHADSSDVLALRYRLALLKQDRAGTDALVAGSHAQSENEVVLWQVQALEAAREGRLEEAGRDSRRAIEMARGAGLTERAAVFEAAQAVLVSARRDVTFALVLGGEHCRRAAPNLPKWANCSCQTQQDPRNTYPACAQSGWI